MGKPAAKKGDQVAGVDTHVVMIPSPTGAVATSLPHPFRGPLRSDLAASVYVDDCEAAVVGSVAENDPPHSPMGGPFQQAPSNKATVQQGSSTVFADGRACARNADPANTCNDPSDAPKGRIIASSTVIVD